MAALNDALYLVPPQIIYQEITLFNLLGVKFVIKFCQFLFQNKNWIKVMIYITSEAQSFCLFHLLSLKKSIISVSLNL